jgi:2-polyprenyl-3-methyl-5-hydroxy-6-metoxy-1,4-benzoquinol methylase/uncharacterized protein YbaR (Trm112 family)
MDDFLLDRIVDPIQKAPLRYAGNGLHSTQGHSYPIVDDIPIMLVDGIPHTISMAENTLKAVHARSEDGSLYLETTGMGQQKIGELRSRLSDTSYEAPIDPVINYLIGATSGLLYEQGVGKFGCYPIPDIRLSTVDDGAQSILDIGCGWGRWSISAAKKGYNVVALDPSLGAVLAGRRVSQQMGLKVHWVVGDARHLPFRAGAFDHVFSYSVIQHFSRTDAKMTLDEVKRVLSSRGTSLVQMANAWGIRSMYHQIRRARREPKDFEVRYYSPSELLDMFEGTIGPSKMIVDGFFGLGIQPADYNIMPAKYKAVISASELLRRLSSTVSSLGFVADSLYLESTKVA